MAKKRAVEWKDVRSVPCGRKHVENLVAVRKSLKVTPAKNASGACGSCLGIRRTGRNLAKVVVLPTKVDGGTRYFRSVLQGIIPDYSKE